MAKHVAFALPGPAFRTRPQSKVAHVEPDLRPGQLLCRRLVRLALVPTLAVALGHTLGKRNLLYTRKVPAGHRITSRRNRSGTEIPIGWRRSAGGNRAPAKRNSLKRPQLAFCARNRSRLFANARRSAWLIVGGPPVFIPLARNVSIKSRIVKRAFIVSCE